MATNRYANPSMSGQLNSTTPRQAAPPLEPNACIGHHQETPVTLRTYEDKSGHYHTEIDDANGKKINPQDYARQAQSNCSKKTRGLNGNRGPV